MFNWFPRVVDDTLPLNLRRLLAVRSLTIAGELLALLVVFWGLQQTLPWLALSLVIGGQVLLNLVAVWRLRQHAAIHSHEFLAHVCADVALLLALFYWAGGAANPFVYLLMLPLLMTAAVLPRAYVWLVAGLVVAGYGWLMLSYQPQTGHQHHHEAQQFDWHVLGMWFGFVFGVLIIVFFVMRMAASLRQREEQLSQVREQALRDEQLIALGTLAAGAAHELGTPLATMAIISKDLLLDYADDAELQSRVGLLRQQIDRCKQTLSMIAMSAGQLRAEQGSGLPLQQFLDELLHEWQQRHLDAALQIGPMTLQQAPSVVADHSLRQALFNLLDNAIQSTSAPVEWQADYQQEQLNIEIRDRGPGVPALLREQLGKKAITTRAEGHGLGLLLAHAVIQRLGGELQLLPREGGGTCARLSLPITKLRLRHPE